MPKLLSPTLLILFVAMAGALTSFYLLLSAIPAYLVDVGAGTAVSGLGNGALLLATVLAELASPMVVRRLGHRDAFALALLALGLPTLLLAIDAGTAIVIAVSAVRGIGFGLIVVLGGELIAAALPAERRAEGLGLYGLVAGAPGILALPAGIFLAHLVGYGAVFLIGGIAALLGAIALPVLPRRPPPLEPGHGLIALLRSAAAIPAGVFAISAAGAGGAMSFAAVAAPAAVAPAALLIHALAIAACRWGAGRMSRRLPPRRQLGPALLLSALGLLCLSGVANPFWAIGGLLLLGIGFGAAQNASLSIMYERSPPPQFGAVSAIWNVAYDGGLALGAMAIGALVPLAGYGGGFAALGTLGLAGLALWRASLRRR